MAGLRDEVPWKRFWIPREHAPQLDWHHYLADPEGVYGNQANPHARTLEQLEDTPCVVLLGEPGSGKSFVIKAYRDGAAARDGAPSVLLIDGRSHRDLDKQLFATAPFQRWLAGSAPLMLLFDSLDEHPLGAHEAGQQLVGHLLNGPLDTLRLRIACRSAEWPAALDQQLPQMWRRDGDEPRAVFYALAPLRRADVALAAEEVAEPFLAAVAAKDAQPLAMMPVTLRFLLTEYRLNGALPRTRVDLYAEGCRILCEESSLSRRGAKKKVQPKAQQRLAVASRIAAVSLLGRRSLVFMGEDLGTVPPDAVKVDELLGGTEPSSLGDVVVDDAAVEEVLGISGLFTSRGGGDCVGWVHQTYAEFLAARFLHGRGLSPDELLRAVSNEAMNRVVPALRETAAWLASMNKEFFERLVNIDPETLLQSDFALVGHSEREALIETVLQKIIARELPDRLLHHGRPPVSRLDHPRLAAQLRPYIADKGCPVPARRAAIGLAEDCRTTAVADLLADVALDPNDDIDVRTAAAHAIVRIGSRETKRRMKSLILAQCGPDPNDELKGYALQALWPNDLGANEMFESLSPPRNPSGGGAYSALLHEIGKTLGVDSLPLALQWSTGVPARHDQKVSSSFVNLLDEVLRAGWQNIETECLQVPFAEAVGRRLVLHDEIFGHKGYTAESTPDIAQDDTRRRLLTRTLLSLAPWGKHEAFAYVDKKMVLPRDLRWVFEQMRTGSSESLRARWALIVRHLAWRKEWSFEVTDPIVAVLPEFPELQELLPDMWPTFVEVGSPESRRWRREHRSRRKEAGQRRRMMLCPPTSRPRRANKNVLRYLRRLEKGDLEAGWKLQLWLMVEQDGAMHGLHKENITAFPGWKRATDAVRARIIKSAQEYLLREDERSYNWLGFATNYHPVHAGYRYLCLLHEHNSTWLDKHERTVWPRWSAISIHFSTNASERSQALVSRAYRAQPARILEALGVKLLQENSTHGYLFVIFHMAKCWDAPLGRFLVEFLQQHSALKPKFMGELLDQMIMHKVEGATTCAVSLLASPVAAEGDDRLRAHAAAHALMAYAPEVGWSAISALIDADSAIVREVFRTFPKDVGMGQSRAWGKGLSVTDTTELYIWVSREFPPADDPPSRFSGAHIITPRHKLADIRDALLSELTSRGTRDAVSALEHIQRTFPHQNLTSAIHAAKEAAAQGTWAPRSPHEILALRPLRSPSPSPSPTTPSPIEPTPMTRDQLFDALCNLLEAQLNALVYKLTVPAAYLPGASASPATRITEILRWADQQGRIADVELRYLEVIGRIAPAAPTVAAYVVAPPIPTPPAPHSPTPAASPVTFPPPIVDAYRRGKLAVLFGSGLSPTKRAGGPFPTWRELPERLLEQSLHHGVLTQPQVDARRAIFTSGPVSLEAMLTELDAIKVALRGARKYQPALEAIFCPPAAAAGDVHRALVDLSVDVLVTTNYDELLEHAEGPPGRAVYTWQEADNVLSRIQAGRKVLFKIHGTADKERTVVMTRREYDEAAQDPGYQQTMRHLLQSYTFLLVGYGINDPGDLDLVFALNASAHGCAASTHYALMKDAQQNDVDRWQRTLNVQVVPYADHADLPAILRALGATKP